MKLKQKNILVTRGTGFIGSRLAKNPTEARKAYPDPGLFRMDASSLAALKILRVLVESRQNHKAIEFLL